MRHFRTTPYKKIAKPLLFLTSPEFIHEQMTKLSYGVGKTPGAPELIRRVMVRRRPELETAWQGMQFTSPVGLSAGFDKNAQTISVMRSVGFGFSTVGSVTPLPCAGNPKPWFYRLPKTQSIVVNAGLANHGVQAILGRLNALPISLQGEYPVVLSVARTNSEAASSVAAGIADYVASIEAAKHSIAVSAFEINISCPNAFGGETFTKPELLSELLDAVDAVEVPQPVLVKMPADLPWEQFRPLLEVIAAHAVAGVTIANLAKDRSTLDLKDPLPDHVKGNLSGAPVRALSNTLIKKTYAAYGDRLMIVGVGGILSAEDAYEKITLGATYVELITGLIFNGPGFIEEVNSGLMRLLRQDGFTHISQAVGSAHKKATV